MTRRGTPPPTREPDEQALRSLRGMLQAALKIEHAVIPPYLTAWLSIREGTNSEAAEILRSVLLEEMLHLTLVANVLNAVGGKPTLTEPDFVLPYPCALPCTAAKFTVSIERFSPAALETFLQIERPEARGDRPKTSGFTSLGQFYEGIEAELASLCGARPDDQRVFSGSLEKQVRPDMYYGAGRVIVVRDLETAMDALREIVHQGEGCPHTRYDDDAAIDDSGGRELAHYYRFMEVRRGRTFKPTDRRKPTGDPLPVDYGAVHPIRANTRLDDYPPGSSARGVLERFADTYGELLAALEDAFNGNPGRLMQAVHTMFTLKYQAQAIMRTPSGRKGGETLGPTFEQTSRRPSPEAPTTRETPGAGDPFPDIDRVIAANAHEFARPGVLTVRPGYLTINGQVTRQAGIVVTTTAQSGVVPVIPPMVGGYMTDVRQASAMKVLRVTRPAEFARRRGAHPHVVEHPYERQAQTGRPLAPVPVAAARKRQVPYSPPRGVSLAPVTGPMTIVCHASPDAGFTQLQAFLADVRKQLTVGLYEFGSRPILETLLAGMKKDQKLSIVLDWPFGESPSDNQTDDDTHAALTKALGKRLTFAWAAERNDPAVDGYVFPSAYHIKVAVKDHKTFWLSSGNWNPSNQPAIDPFKQGMTAADRDAMLRTVQRSDRDWHVIVTHAGLAKTFEAYLQHDLQVASTLQAKKKPAPAKLPHAQQAAAKANWVPSFKPLTIEGNIPVQPLLTPDTGKGNYVAAILELIASAKRTLYIQTQYIELPTQPETAKGVAALVAAVDAKIKAGLDVRIIVSEFETGQHAEYLERLQHAGFDIAKMRIQTGVHNKGFLIDSKVVALGSQNWSSAGVLQNRDATLVIHDARAAKYFEQIFLHDWETLARPAHAPAAAALA